MRATATGAAAALDPLDPVAAPFGAFAMSPRLARLRAMVLSERWPAFVGHWLYKLFAHLTKQRGLVVDLEFKGMKRRLFVDEFAHDRWIFRKGRHAEPDELATLETYAGRDAVFLDIGANNGFFAVLAAQILGGAARILAFEPHPRTFRKLALHLAMNAATRVEAHNIALGDREDVLALGLSRDDGSHSLAVAADASIEVRVRPLLTVVQEAGLTRVDLLKIDVEGFEDAVLGPYFAQAPDALMPREIMMEVSHRATRWRSDVLAAAVARGYRIDKETKDNAWLTWARA